MGVVVVFDPPILPKEALVEENHRDDDDLDDENRIIPTK